MYNKKIVLDFDGTIMRLFANYDLKRVLVELHNMFKVYNIVFDLSNDIFDAFTIAMRLPVDLKDEVLFKANEIVKKAEIEAIDSGIIINGFFEFLNFAISNKLSVSIVTNNSSDCILKFLDKYCNDLSMFVRGRLWQRPDLMKPSPYLLHEICRDLVCSNKDIVFIGDNPRDFESADQFGCDFIGLTPTEKKKKRMSDIQNIKILNDFHELIAYLKTYGYYLK